MEIIAKFLLDQKGKCLFYLSKMRLIASVRACVFLSVHSVAGQSIGRIGKFSTIRQCNFDNVKNDWPRSKSQKNKNDVNCSSNVRNAATTTHRSYCNEWRKI